MVLRLTSSDLAAIRRHGEQTYPHECCGVLLGEADEETKTVRAVLPCANTRTDSPRNRYNIDPLELVRAQKLAREHGCDIIGFYHSHPDHPARWSKTDLEEAHWLGCSYMITSVAQGCAAETKSFLLAGEDEKSKRLEAEAIEEYVRPLTDMREKSR